MKDYIKRGIKYILYEHKQPIVNVKISKNEEQFTNKNVLITGGGSGIGYEIAKKIISQGGLAIITGRSEEKLKKAKTELGDNCIYYVCDISNIENSKNVLNSIYDKYLKIDALINNAGISLHEWDFLKVTQDGFDQQFNTNLKGPYFFTQAYIEILLKNKQEGNIIFISSERGEMAEVIPYGLTKSAINSLVKGLSYKYYKNGIRINAVSPGVTATSMIQKEIKNDDLYSDNVPGRIFLPEEVAELVCFLISDSSKCISGENVSCNGGNHIKMGW